MSRGAHALAYIRPVWPRPDRHRRRTEGNNELVRRSLDDHLHRHCGGLRQGWLPAHPRVAHAAVAKATPELGAITPAHPNVLQPSGSSHPMNTARMPRPTSARASTHKATIKRSIRLWVGLRPRCTTSRTHQTQKKGCRLRDEGQPKGVTEAVCAMSGGWSTRPLVSDRKDATRPTVRHGGTLPITSVAAGLIGRMPDFDCADGAKIAAKPRFPAHRYLGCGANDGGTSAPLTTCRHRARRCAPAMTECWSGARRAAIGARSTCRPWSTPRRGDVPPRPCPTRAAT